MFKIKKETSDVETIAIEDTSVNKATRGIESIYHSLPPINLPMEFSMEVHAQTR